MSSTVYAATYANVCQLADEQGVDLSPWGDEGGLLVLAEVKQGAFGWPRIGRLLTD